MGEVLGAWGVRGAVRIRTYTAAPDALLGFAAWRLQRTRDGEWQALERRDARLHSGTIVATLGGFDSREAAQALKGSRIGVPRDALPRAAPGEMYQDDLIGLEVVNREGVLLGTVSGVTEHGAHPLLMVARPAGSAGPERLIPVVAAIVDGIDADAGRIVVDWGADY